MKRPSYEELKAQVGKLTDDSLEDVDVIRNLRNSQVNLLEENNRLHSEVAWLKSRWPLPEEALKKPEDVPLVETPSFTIQESQPDNFPWVAVIILVLLGLAVAAWQGYYYFRPNPVKPTAEVTTPEGLTTHPMQPAISDTPDANGDVVLKDSGTNGYPVSASTVEMPTTFEVYVHAKQRCWVTASNAEDTLYDNFVEANANLVFESGKFGNITIQDGCPGKLEFARDGETVHPVPQSGHKKGVEVVIFEREKQR